MRVFCFVLFVLICAIPIAARPVESETSEIKAEVEATSVKVAVVPFFLEGGTDKTRAGYFAWQVEAFKNIGWTVVSRDAVADAMKALGFDEGSKLTEKNLFDIGKKVGAEVVVGGNIKIETKTTTHIFSRKANVKIDLKPIGIDLNKGSSGDVFYDAMNNDKKHSNTDLATTVSVLVSMGGGLIISPSYSKPEEKTCKQAFGDIAKLIQEAYRKSR